MKAKISLTVILLTTLTFACLKGEIIRIPVDYPLIQSGIDSASDGDTILVADGIYESQGSYNTEVINFKGKKILVKSENGPKNCILKRGDVVVRFNSGETHNSILDGFTLTDADPGSGIECSNSSPTIMNNIICNNWSEYGLGAIYLENSSAVLINNLFFGNAVYGESAGITCWDSTHVSITNNTFFGGSEIYPLNCSYVNVLCDSTSSAKIANCIFWHTGSLDFKNCSIVYSCIDKEVNGTNNIQTYPEFTDTTTSDFSLMVNSTCINSGTEDTTGLNLPDVDILGNIRIFGQRIEIGAYEFQDVTGINNFERPSIIIYPNPTKGKVNFDFKRLTGSQIIIEIYSLEGKQIFSKSIQKLSNLTVDLTDNPKGVYIVSLHLNGEILNKKICIE